MLSPDWATAASGRARKHITISLHSVLFMIPLLFLGWQFYGQTSPYEWGCTRFVKVTMQEDQNPVSPDCRETFLRCPGSNQTVNLVRSTWGYLCDSSFYVFS